MDSLGFISLDYNTRVVLLGTLALGAAAGVIGTLALLRRRALLGDALAHSTLPGVWLAFLLFGKNFMVLMAGATVSGLLGVATVALLSRYTRIKEDASIGIVLSVFFGAGLMLSSWVHHHTTDASQSGIEGYLLGKTAGMLASDAQFIVAVGVTVLIVVALLFKELKLLCFDPNFAAVQGWPVLGLDFAVLALLTATTVIGLPAVGVVMIVAMLIMPGAAARFWTDRLSTLLVLAGALGVLIAGTGTLASSAFERLPAGPVIVLCGTTVFVISVIFAPRRGLLSRWRAERSHRSRRLRQRLLRLCYESIEDNPDGPPPSLDTVITRTGAVRRRVARALDRLRRDGILSPRRDAAELTAHGWDRAARVVRTVRLWEQYLLTHANIDRDLVDPDVDVIESLLPAELVQKLEVGLVDSSRSPATVDPRTAVTA